jgi:hypothetical protein
MGVRTKEELKQRNKALLEKELAKNAEAQSQLNVTSLETGQEPLPVIYSGQWLCNKTLLDVACIVTDGIQASELKWSPEMKQTPVPIWITSEGKLCCMMEQRDTQGLRQKEKVTGELQSQDFGPELLVWENGHVWRRGPTRECPDSWLAVDAQIVRGGQRFNAGTKGKVRKGAKLTVTKVVGRDAKVSMPVEGWITASKVVMKTEGTSLPREHVQQLLLPDDPVQRLQQSGSVARLFRRFSDPSALTAAEPDEVTLQKADEVTLQKERRSSEPNLNAAEALKVEHPIGDLFETPAEFNENESSTTTASMDDIIKVVEDKEVKTDQTGVPDEQCSLVGQGHELPPWVSAYVENFTMTENLDILTAEKFYNFDGDEKSLTSYRYVEM